MQDCEHYDALRLFDTIEDSIREARNKCATHLAVHARKPSDGKQPGEPLASPGFGEHLVSGNDVVGVTLVFC